MTLIRSFPRPFSFAVAALGLCFWGSFAQVADAYPMTPEQRERLKTYIPRTAFKLERQDPVHIVAAGDSVTWMFSQNRALNGDFLQSYATTFARELAKEFFYPGGVRVVNPVEGREEKPNENLGAEIWIESMATPGATSIDALRRFTTEAFLNSPDLVTINYGINDAIRNLSLGQYRNNLQRMVDMAKDNGADVIIFGPSPITESAGDVEWGLERPFVTVAREVAEQNGVFFIDMGQIVANYFGGIEAEYEPDVAIETIGAEMRDIFNHGEELPVVENLHPSPETQKFIGEIAFQYLMDGPSEQRYSAKASIQYQDEDTLELTVALRNQTSSPQKGYLAALAIGKQFVPKDPYRSFDLETGKQSSLSFTYKRIAERAVDEEVIYYPEEITEANIRMSFLVTDAESTCFVDEVRRLEPVGVLWESIYLSDVTDVIPLEWRFVNGSDEAVRGRYTISIGDQQSSEDFSLSPLGSKRFFARFPFAPAPTSVRAKQAILIEVEVGERTFTFRRNLEAVRDLGLGNRVALAQEADYYRALIGEQSGELAQGTSGVSLRADADEQFLFLTFDIQNVALFQLPGSEVEATKALIADIQIDARPVADQGIRGYIGKIRVTTGATDGPGTTSRLLPGVMGEGYAFIFEPEGVVSALRRESPNAKRLEVRIPRTYLALHGWNLGSKDSTLGLNAVLSFAESNGEGGVVYSSDRRYVHARSELYSSDTWSLAKLRLTNEPVNSWSVRLD